jgi:integrase
MQTKKTYPIQTKYPGVRETGPDRYELSYYPYKGAKKKKYKTVDAKSAKKASDKRDELVVSVKKDSDVPFDVKDRPYVDFDFARKRLEADLSASTRKTILRCLGVFDRLFYAFRSEMFPSVKHPANLSLPFFQEYKNYYCKTLNRVKGWRSEITFVKIIISRLYKLGFCSKDIVEQLKNIKRPEANIPDYVHISNTKISQILHDIKSKRPDLHRVLLFLKRTGRRIEEVTLIEKKDVVWDGFKLVRINIRPETTKSKKPAPLDVFDDELESLIRQAYIESSKHKSPYLFLNRQHKKVNQKRVCENLKKVSKQILGAEITPHYFRKRFCTECVKAGVSYKDIMAITGHRDIQVLIRHYDHGSVVGKRKALEVSRG